MIECLAVKWKAGRAKRAITLREDEESGGRAKRAIRIVIGRNCWRGISKTTTLTGRVVVRQVRQRKASHLSSAAKAKANSESCRSMILATGASKTSTGRSWAKVIIDPRPKAIESIESSE